MGVEINAYVPDYVMFDLETTGISWKKDAVIEISALKVREGKTVEEFSSLVNPRRPIPAEASQVNHITDDMVAEAPYFEEVLARFLDFIGEDVLAGHNIRSFDLKFLKRDIRVFYGGKLDNSYVDTLVLARTALPQLSSRSLESLARYYGFSTEGAHRALNDCRINKLVYEKLAGELAAAETGEQKLRLCPECGKLLKLRNGRFGEFWGCSGYPRCRHTEDAS